MVVFDKKERICKKMILQFQEIVGLRRRRKISRLGKGVTEDMEC